MSRVPAEHLAFLEDVPAPPESGSKRVLKSVHVEASTRDILIAIPATSHSAPVIEPTARIERPAEEKTETVNEAVRTAERNFELRLAAAIEQARAEGYAEGLAEGQATASGGIAERTANLNQAIVSLRGAWDSFSERSEPLIAELGFRLAEAILQSPLPDHLRSISSTALSEAIERIGQADSIQVTVHPADFMALTENGLIAQIGQNHPELAWRTDAALERGDWEARSNSAVVRRVALEMLEEMRIKLTLAATNSRSN